MDIPAGGAGGICRRSADTDVSGRVEYVDFVMMGFAGVVGMVRFVQPRRRCLMEVYDNNRLRPQSKLSAKRVQEDGVRQGCWRGKRLDALTMA